MSPANPAGLPEDEKPLVPPIPTYPPARGRDQAVVQSGSLIHSSKSSPPRGDFWTYFLDPVQLDHILDLFWTWTGIGLRGDLAGLDLDGKPVISIPLQSPFPEIARARFWLSSQASR